MVTIKAPPIIISFQGRPALRYLPGLHAIRYNKIPAPHILKDELVAKQTVYMSMLLDYLEAYRAKGLNIPASIRNLTSLAIAENFSSWLDYYFEPYDTHVQKQSLYKMYDATVGAIDEKQFNKMLKQCDKIIARGLHGKKLLSRGGDWIDVDSREKRTVVKNIRLKLNH
eukprot:g8113.t1